MHWTGQFFSRLALDLLSFPISTANVERAFSGLRFVNRKKRAAITNCNVANYSCIYILQQIISIIGVIFSHWCHSF